MSAWRLAYKGTRLTLGFIMLIVALSHIFMFMLWIAVIDHFGRGVGWVGVIPPLVHLTVVSLLMIMAVAVDTGRYELAKVLALVTAMVDIFTLIPILLRLIFLSMISRWLGEVGGLAAPVIIFILVYFIEDLRQAGRPRTVNRRF